MREGEGREKEERGEKVREWYGAKPQNLPR